MSKESIIKTINLASKVIIGIFATWVLALFSVTHFYKSALNLEPISYVIYTVTTVALLFLFRKMGKIIRLICIPLAILILITGFLWAPISLGDNYVNPCVEMNKKDPSTNYCAL